MKSGKCPKCNSATVYTKRLGVTLGGGGFYLSVSGKPVREVDYYLCATCGYMETYVEDKPKLEAVTKDWSKVG